MYQGFNTKIIGYSHNEKGIPCQDAVSYIVSCEFAIVAASDGHGGEKYFRSGEGAKIAVEVAIRCVQEFLKTNKKGLVGVSKEEWDRQLKHIAKRTILAWQTEIEKHFNEHPLEQHEKELCVTYDMVPDNLQAQFYGATLLYACLTPEYSFASQIGDGACVFFDAEANPEIPAALEDSRLGFGLTTSLCDSNAIDNFRHHFKDASEGLPKAIFLYTDGIVDSYEPTSFLEAFNRKVLAEMRKDRKEAKAALTSWLPQLSEQGSQDDVSMAGIYTLDDSIGERI